MRTTHGDEGFDKQIREAREALEHVKEDRKAMLREVMG